MPVWLIICNVMLRLIGLLALAVSGGSTLFALFIEKDNLLQHIVISNAAICGGFGMVLYIIGTAIKRQAAQPKRGTILSAILRSFFCLLVLAGLIYLMPAKGYMWAILYATCITILFTMTLYQTHRTIRDTDPINKPDRE